MKKNSFFQKLLYIICFCLFFAVTFIISPTTANASTENGLKVSIKVHSPKQMDMSIGQGKKSLVIHPGGAYVLNTVKKTNSSDYVYESIFFDCYNKETQKIDLTLLPFIGTNFTLTRIDLPQGYELDCTELPMDRVFSYQMYSQMLEASKAGKPVLGELIFDVYVRPAGTKSDISKARIESSEDLTYNGQPQKFKGKLVYHDTVLVEDRDYLLDCTNNINPGKADVTFRGIGNFAGSNLKATYNILPATMNSKNTSVSPISDQKYTGKALKPSVTVKVNGKTLKSGKDYTVTYSNNVKIGKASVTITGKGCYTGSHTVYFKIINPLPKKGATFTVGNGKYKVTNSSATKGTVTFLAPTSTKLRGVTIPSTVTYNGYSFKVTTIYINAFKNNKDLTKVKVGKYIESIGSYAFYGATKLKSIEFTGTSIKSVGKNIFRGIYSKATIKVPSSRYKTYSRLFKDKGQSSRVKIVK